MPESSTTSHLALSADLPPWATLALFGLLLVSLAALAFETRRSERAGAFVFLSGAVALFALGLAALRPTRVIETGRSIPARLAVLVDTSLSMALESTRGETRAAAAGRVMEELTKSPDVRVDLLGFGTGEATALTRDEKGGGVAFSANASGSDLATALRGLAAGASDPPSAIVVISDGRLDDPPEGAGTETLRALGALARAKIHAIAVSDRSPRDASVRKVGAVGSAVAHVPLQLRVEVGCAGGLSCGDVPLTVRELREGGAPSTLSSAVAHVKDGTATVEMTITLDRAGPRVLEVALEHQDGDEVAENDRRFVTFHVAREHVRVLHIAGRPTEDVRSFRRWIKANPSVDTVAFFILRTPTDTSLARDSDLALIPFPVDELFTTHLASFDAVILQDFDAQPYGLQQHLPALARYVRSGGGLIMVGGPNSFVAGGYAASPLADVLPVTLDGKPGATAADTSPFVPAWSKEGLSFPAVSKLRDALGTELPEMPGANVLGDARDGALVLWSHPVRHTARGARMPVLALADVGNGRSIALGIDGTWQLQFSELGAKTGGIGYGALWDGLLGWLMHDPRFEPIRAHLASGCVSNTPATLLIDAPLTEASATTQTRIEVTRLDRHEAPFRLDRPLRFASGRAEVTLPNLPSGGYVARVRLDGAPGADAVFACEAGGDEWADSRPDPDRLKRLAQATGGVFSLATEGAARSIPLPNAKHVIEERHSAPLVPPWLLSLSAAVLLALHWLLRRRRGLA